MRLLFDDFDVLGAEGAFDQHRLFHAWNDRIWAAQKNQGELISVFCFSISSLSIILFSSGDESYHLWKLSTKCCRVRWLPKPRENLADVLLLSIVDTVSSVLKQESSMFREVPVVIMSSENILTRIARYWLRLELVLLALPFILCPLRCISVSNFKNLMIWDLEGIYFLGFRVVNETIMRR